MRLFSLMFIFANDDGLWRGGWSFYGCVYANLRKPPNNNHKKHPPPHPPHTYPKPQKVCETQEAKATQAKLRVLQKLRGDFDEKNAALRKELRGMVVLMVLG